MKRSYNIGGVKVDIDWTSNIEQYQHKFRILRMAMDNWEKKNGNFGMDSHEGRMYSDDCEKYNTMKTLLSLSEDDFAQGKRGKRHKRLMNEMFRRYNA